MKLRFALLFALALSAGCASSTAKDASVPEEVRVLEEEHSPERLLARGRALARLGDHVRAEQYLSAALDRGAKPAEALPPLLRVCIEARKFRVALDYAEPYLRQDPGDLGLRFVVASLYSTIGEPDAAKRHLEEIVRRQPDNAEVRFALGVLLRDDAGDLRAADEHFRVYLRLEPRGVHAPEARESLLQRVTPRPPPPEKPEPAPPEPAKAEPEAAGEAGEPGAAPEKVEKVEPGPGKARAPGGPEAEPSKGEPGP